MRGMDRWTWHPKLGIRLPARELSLNLASRQCIAHGANRRRGPRRPLNREARRGGLDALYSGGSQDSAHLVTCHHITGGVR